MKIPTSWTNEPELVSVSSSQCPPLSSTATPLHHDDKPVQQPAPSKARKSVHFAPTMVIYETLALDDYTPQEVQACWWDSAEYASFRSTALVTIGLYRAGMLADEEQQQQQYCMRGIEGRLQETSQERYAARFSVNRAVFGEQYDQMCRGIRNPARIAELCQAVTWRSAVAAHEQALLDERAAGTYTTISTYLFSPPSSPKSSNVLRKLIHCERDATCYEPFTTSSFASSCAVQQSVGDNFDVNNFFLHMTPTAAAAQ
jgi:hypothetical protein